MTDSIPTGTRARITVLDPTGFDPRATRARAPRSAGLNTLKGARIGLLHNTKEHGDLLLTEVARHLQDEYGALIYGLRRKPEVAEPVTPEICNEFLAQCDAVITASAD